MVKKVATILCVLACLLSYFLGCNNANSYDSLSLSYFNTHIYVQTVDKKIPNQTKDKLNNLFSSLQEEFSISDEQSFVYKFNIASEGSCFTLSEQGAKLFEIAYECFSFTQGLFDPTVYPLVELWQFAPNYPVENFNLPTNEQINSLLPLVDFNSIDYDKQTRTVTKLKSGVKLDFGAILKGYAVDIAGQILIDDGIEKGYISIGGSSIFILQSEKLDVRHPRQTAQTPVILSVNTSDIKNFSVSSSGDYEKFYTLDNKIYSHLINPQTGTPALTNIQSVSILGVDGTKADAFSTVGCLLTHTPEDITGSPLINFFKQIVFSYPNAKIFAVFDNGNYKQVITNAHQSTHFTLHDNSFSIVNF